jgi:hypothetical protein
MHATDKIGGGLGAFGRALRCLEAASSRKIRMVALDFYAADISALSLRDWRRTNAFIFGSTVLSGGIGLIFLSAQGGGEYTWDAAAEYVSHFSSVIFLSVFIAGPAARLFPARATEMLNSTRNRLVAAFLASYAVFIAFLAMSFHVGDTRMDTTTIVFCWVAGIVGAVMSLSTVPNTVPLAHAIQDKLQRIAMGYFWLSFVLDDVRHIYGPHRPDHYYGPALLVFIGAILLRFADDFRQRIYLRSRLRNFSLNRGWTLLSETVSLRRPHPARTCGQPIVADNLHAAAPDEVVGL